MGSLDRFPHSNMGYGKLLGEGYHKLDWNSHQVSYSILMCGCSIKYA